MDWPTRMVVGLLAWPMMIFLVILLSFAVEPGSHPMSAVVVLLAVEEVFAAAVAIVFPVWALLSWAQNGDDWDSPRP